MTASAEKTDRWPVPGGHVEVRHLPDGWRVMGVHYLHGIIHDERVARTDPYPNDGAADRATDAVWAAELSDAQEAERQAALGARRILEKEAWRRARSLGVAHGHDWAVRWACPHDERREWTDGACPDPPVGHSWEELRADFRAWEADRRREDDWEGPAATAPWPEHRTATGRLRWTIDTDSSVTVEVHRPVVGAVLRAHWDRAGDVTVTVLGDYAERHVEALQVAARSLAADLYDDCEHLPPVAAWTKAGA